MNILPSNQLGVEAPDEKDPTEKVKVGAHNCKSEEKGLGLSSPPPKRRKNDTLQLYGGRIIRSTGTKNRHSKVWTARGPRDRRLRLSPKTAISFYDVQERLGYDRPSKAIDWLMKEAKSAIDALHQPPLIHHPNTHHMFKTEIGIITEHLNNEDPVSSFGFFTHASTSEDRVSSAPLATPPEIFDTNLEIARLQRILSWNYYNSCVSPPPPPLHFPTPVDLGHGYTFSDREPLQSRISNYSPQFPAVNFSNEELLNFTGAATFKEDDMDIIPLSSKSSSTATFLH